MNLHRLSCLSALLFLVSAASAYAQQPILLFDGTSLQGWVRLDGKPIDDSWEAVDGTLHLKNVKGGGANLVTEEEYGDFDLEFEWKIAPGGNNGLKYRVRQYGNQWLGCEYQMLDDAAYKLNPRGMTGSLYELYEPNSSKHLKPVGEFNHSRVVVRGNHIAHWLNGELIVTAEVGSPEWYQRVSESKFAKYEGFGENRLGKIMLTDHGSEVWYRNVLLTPLPPPTTTYRYAETGSERLRLFGWRPSSKCRHATKSRIFSRLRGRH